MGLNRLYSDHQRMQMRADDAPPGRLKSEHQLAASLIAGQIGCIQHALGATAARGWHVLAVVAPPSFGFQATGSLESGSAALVAADQARRGKEISQLASLLLGTERAATFLEQPNDNLGDRPLKLAIDSPEGRDRVEAELGRLISHPPSRS